jgi:predicted deacylase
LWAVIVSRDGLFDPVAAKKAGRAVVLIQNGIHAGEIDGKDASLALLRDMVITKSSASLLENATIVIIPVYNADGHERIKGRIGRRFCRGSCGAPQFLLPPIPVLG